VVYQGGSKGPYLERVPHHPKRKKKKEEDVFGRDIEGLS
jgi:hypothetical protein